MDEETREFLLNLDDMLWWRFDSTTIGMGAERQFDYTMRGDLGRDLTPRLGDCYMLAMQAFTGWDRFTHGISNPVASIQDGNHSYSLPAPDRLVHGSWHHWEEPTRIKHAWVILADLRVWEPITGLICDPVQFAAFGRVEVDNSYTGTEARVQMLRAQHYGPWA